MLVGHGPSSGRASLFIDDHTVVRLATAGWEKPGRGCPFPGTRTDYLCSTLAKYSPDWLIQGELERLCRATLAPFNPKNPKPSTGLCAAIVARHYFPDEDIQAVGYDWTFHPETAVNYRHDAYAEHECIKTLRVSEYG